jgi:virulence-associated protein VapD
MFAVAFDLFVAETELHHPMGVSQAYRDIGAALTSCGFERVQGSVHICGNDDLANLFSAIMTLALPWFPRCVRDIRAFKVELWSDFTGIVKG